MRIAVIGAGLAGLTAAYELSKANPDAEIDVFEASDRIGGKLFSAHFESGPVDVGSEAFLFRRPDTVAFFTELGLEDSFRHPAALSSSIYSGGERHPMPRPTMMGIPASSQSLAGLISEETATRIDQEGDAEGIDWDVDGDRNVGELVRSRMGDEVADRVVSALLGGVYSCSADDLGVRATVPRLAAAMDELAEAGEKVTLTGAIKKIFGTSQAPASKDDQAQKVEPQKPAPFFGSFAGGFEELYETLAEKSNANIYVDAFVSGIEKQGDKFLVKGGGEPAQKPYDRVLLATPAPTTAPLLKKISPEAAEALGRIKLADSVVVAIKFDSDEGLPEASGVMVAADEPGMHAKAFTFSSKKWPHIGAEGEAVIRASFGRFGDSTAINTDEDTLVDWALDDLEKITGFDGRAAEPSEIFTQRWFGGLPRYDETHLDTVAEIRAAVDKLEGLEVTGAWAGGVGVPAVIADARAAAGRLLS